MIVISKNVIILPYIKGSCLFKGDLWHKHDQHECKSIIRIVGFSKCNKLIYLYHQEEAST